jgi:hypothetical protein
MELATLEVSQEEARKALTAYRRSVKDRQEAEVQAIMRGYRAIAKGTKLIRLSEVLAAGGSVNWHSGDRKWRMPNLAVMRASEKWAWCSGIDRDGSVSFVGEQNLSWRNRRRRVALPSGTFPRDDERPRRSSFDALRAMVPLVPPPLRPAHDLGNYHILWEAEWRSVPPRDPALLKRLSGDLYAVIAVWDLTELERAVLAGRTMDT